MDPTELISVSGVSDFTYDPDDPEDKLGIEDAMLVCDSCGDSMPSSITCLERCESDYKLYDSGHKKVPQLVADVKIGTKEQGENHTFVNEETDFEAFCTCEFRSANYCECGCLLCANRRKIQKINKRKGEEGSNERVKMRIHQYQLDSWERIEYVCRENTFHPCIDECYVCAKERRKNTGMDVKPAKRE